ncbi:MAG: aminoglycoside adenylyltransferase domain-containing protein [Pyrinomonadaceae bacterium]
MNLPADITELLNALLAGVQQRLKDNLVGVYLRGSLALGDFIPETSDVDVLAVTERPVDDAEFADLATLHTQLATLANPYANRHEIAYIDRAALRQFQPGLRHPSRGQGETLVWTEHHANWILERWAVREHGVTLLGPAPQTLIDPISPGELDQAVRARLLDWVDWAQNLADPDWRAPRRAAATYVVETMCRTLYALACAELPSKPQAVAWALEILPEPWRSTVARSQQWRTDDTRDSSIVPAVTGFIFWAGANCAHANLKRRANDHG